MTLANLPDFTAKKPQFNRKYKITIGPVTFPIGDDAMEMIAPITEHFAQGADIKYVHGIDTGFMHLVNKDGEVTFVCPTSGIVFMEMVQEDAKVVPLRSVDNGV